MNKGEFLNYLSKRYEIEIIVDMPEPKEGDMEGKFQCHGGFNPSIHLYEKVGICITLHEIGHWVRYKRFINLHIIHYRCQMLLANLPLPFFYSLLLSDYIYILFRFFEWLSKLNEENRCNDFACLTCNGGKFPMEKDWET
jgi:hypothetical protein